MRKTGTSVTSGMITHIIARDVLYAHVMSIMMHTNKTRPKKTFADDLRNPDVQNGLWDHLVIFSGPSLDQPKMQQWLLY